jgi:hypothetical protein
MFLNISSVMATLSLRDILLSTGDQFMKQNL